MEVTLNYVDTVLLIHKYIRLKASFFLYFYVEILSFAVLFLICTIGIKNVAKSYKQFLEINIISAVKNKRFAES